MELPVSNKVLQFDDGSMIGVQVVVF